MQFLPTCTLNYIWRFFSTEFFIVILSTEIFNYWLFTSSSSWLALSIEVDLESVPAALEVTSFPWAMQNSIHWNNGRQDISEEGFFTLEKLPF